jgi:hypothetical protein
VHALLAVQTAVELGFACFSHEALEPRETMRDGTPVLLPVMRRQKIEQRTMPGRARCQVEPVAR